ncbi:MAG: polymer-forming cytoskeletal protein [Pseudomonadota bacterium]
MGAMMFDNGKRRGGTVQSTDGCETLVGAGSRLKGEIDCKGPSRIAGVVEGELSGDDRLVIGKDAHVHGEVAALEIEIDGRVTGTITATQRVILNETAIVEGDLHSPSVVIEEGAVFNGKSSMPSPDQQSTSSTTEISETAKDQGTNGKADIASAGDDDNGASGENVHALEINAEKSTRKSTTSSAQEETKAAKSA